MRQWNIGIRASDGAICPKKTKLFLIDFEWNDSYYEYHIIEYMPGCISTPDEDKYMIIIIRDKPLLENESLGI